MATTTRGYKRIPSSEENVIKYKKQYSKLSHVKVGNGFDGVILIDGDIFVAVLQCNINTKYIVALEVSDKYRRKGIAGSLLNLAIKKFECNKLTVNKTNKEAIALYEKHGYKLVKENGLMWYMEKPIVSLEKRKNFLDW